MTSMVASDLSGRARRVDASRSAGVALLSLLLALFAVLLPPPVAAQDADGEGTFRPACQLITADEMGAIVDASLSPSELGPQFCTWESDGPTVYVALDETGGVAVNRLVVPGAEDLTIAGREAISSPGEDQIPATVVVGLDGGGIIRVQVAQAAGVPADPVAAAVAIAEAMFASGPILARPPSESSGPSLGFEGPVCDLVTLDEVRQATGEQGFSSAQEDIPGSCTYGSDDFSLLASVSFTPGELFRFRSGESVDLSIGGLPAVWSTDMFNSLVIDVGGGRVLQVALLALEGGPGQLREAAEAIAEVAVGRLAPVELPGAATPAPAGPGCDLLPVDEVASITGLAFTTAVDDEGSGTSCSYGTSDPANEPYFLIVTRVPADDPSAAIDMFAEDMSGLPEPHAVEVAGRPGLSVANETVAFAIVDLDGIAGEDGRVLAIVWFFPPAGADSASLVIRLAESAIGGL